VFETRIGVSMGASSGAWRVGLALLLLLTFGLAAMAQPAQATARPAFAIRPVDDAWRAALPHEAEAATRAYLDRLPAESKARSDAYFEGGYWLLLWNFLAGVAVAAVLLGT